MIVHRRILLALAAGVILPCAVHAQEDRSVFALLDPAGRTVELGSEVSGELTAPDPLTGDGRRVQVWTLRLDGDLPVQVDLLSGDFDPYLYVVGPGLGEGLRDDDGGEGLNSRLCFRTSEAGEYRVVASSLGGGRGSFRLSAHPNPGGLCGAATGSAEVTDLAELPVDDRILVPGTPMDGILGDDDPRFFGGLVEAWGVQGRAGEPFSVDLHSTSFDAYLTVLGPGLDDWLTDDDGAGGCNARVTFEFPADGEYRVVVSTLGGGDGAYTLTPSREPGPASDEACTGIALGGDVDLGPGAEAELEVPLEEFPIVGALPLPGTVNGVFQGDEWVYSTRSVQGWTLAGTEGEKVAITLTSSDFDPYLYLTGPGWDDPVRDDDSAGGLNARICAELPRDGEYRVFTGPFSRASAGDAFRVEVLGGADADALCEGDFVLAPSRVAAALAALDPEGRTLSDGDEVTGELSPEAPRNPEDGKPVQPWRLTGAPGTEIWVDVVSNDFDPTVRVVWPGLEEVLYNDDAGEGCNSRLAVTLPASGEATVLAGSFYTDARGTFTLRASSNPGPLEAGGCGATGTADTGFSGSGMDLALLEGIEAPLANTLELGTEVRGFLDVGGEVTVDGNPGQAWSFRGRAGDEVVVEVLSDDFDTVLYLGGPGLESVLFDDDSAGSLDSRIQFILPESGSYTLVVAAFSEGAFGTFRLRALRRVGS